MPGIQSYKMCPCLYNTDITCCSVDDERPATELLSDTPAAISSTGDISWPMPVITKTTCRVNIADYPFDVQRCPLRFGSWSYKGYELNLTTYAETAVLDNYEGNGEWHLVGVPCERHEVYLMLSQKVESCFSLI